MTKSGVMPAATPFLRLASRAGSRDPIMDDLPGELIAHIYQLSTPNRRKALLQVNHHFTQSIRRAITSCTSDAEALALPPCRRRYPKLATVQLRVSLGQLIDFFGAFVTFVLPDDRALLTASVASLATFRHSCVVLGPTIATFHITTALQCLAAGCIVTRCLTLREASFIRADAIAQSVPPIISDTLQVIRLYGLGCDCVAAKNLRKLVIYRNTTTVVVDDLPLVVKIRLDVHRLQEFNHSWRRLERLCICSRVKSTITMQSLPALRRLDLNNVDVHCHDLPGCSPLLEDVILDDSRLLDLTPTQAMDQLLSLPVFDTISMELSDVGAGEGEAWRDVLTRLATVPEVRLASTLQPSTVVLFAWSQRT